MAALQTIRDRGGLLISIVIGLALAAFIIGDALSSGSSVFNSERNQAGEIAGESVSIMDYQNMVSQQEELIKAMNGLSALNEEQQTMLRNNIWQQLVMTKLMDAEYEEIGLGVSSEELYDIMLGDNMSPSIRQLFADPTTGTVDKERARTIVSQILESPDQGQKAYWLNMEKEIGENRKLTKYHDLVGKALFITDEQATENAAGNVSKADISYIVKNYNTIDDSTISISNKEIETYYQENQARFQQEESRRIAYVNFDIDPSGEDYAETEKAVAELVDEFAASDEPMEFVNLTSDRKADLAYYKKSELGNDSVANYLFAHKNRVYGPYLENNAYKISRVGSVKMLPDSVRARHILIAPQNNNYAQAKAVADSLANLLKKGANFEQLARANSTDQNSAVNGGDLGWFNQRTMVQPFSDTVFFAKRNEIKVVVTQFGAHVVQVTQRAKPVEKIQVATIEKEITPSNKTTNKIYNDARHFASQIANAEDFNKQAEEQGLTKRIATVNKNDKTIAGMDNARDMIRQIYLAEEPGLVKTTDESIIFTNGNKYTVAILTQIDEEGTTPIRQVSATIKRILMQQKKAELLKKELAGLMSGSESLLSVAQKAGVDVKEAAEVSFNSFQIPGAGIEPRVIAAASVTEQGKLSMPIEGNQGVYVLMVNSRTNEEVTPEMVQEARTNMTQMNLYRANYQAVQAIIKHGEVKDQRYKFY
jgi:peptidyl-prolyl cis-trans isomerase D